MRTKRCAAVLAVLGLLPLSGCWWGQRDFASGWTSYNPFEQTLSDDQLHMNDWSYGCIAKLMATSIVDAIRSPTMAKVPAGVR